jgi:hypothetical protein
MVFAAASSASAAEAIPVRMIDGLPVVEVQLGAIKADFLLDTGGQLAITVPPPLINSATGVRLGTDQRKMGDAAGNVFMVQSLVATSVRLGSAELGPVDGLVNYKWGLNVGADPNLSHRADRILSQGWKPTLRLKFRTLT